MVWIIIWLIGVFVIKGRGESKSKSICVNKFEIKGVVVLVIMVVSLNILISKGWELGVRWVVFISLLGIGIGCFSLFIVVEKGGRNGLMDFKLFKNKG